MTIELVDGKAGTPHISSEDKAIIHQAKFGSSDYVYDWGDSMSCTMQSANKALIGKGCASIQGLDWHVTDPETVTIDSGSSGMKRNDIIAAHYHRDSSTGIETVSLTVFKGSASSNAATDPEIPSHTILKGATDAYMPLYRIPLDGITVGTPVQLFAVKHGIWTSTTLYSGEGFAVISSGFVVFVRFSGKISAGSWDSMTCKYVLPKAYRPPFEVDGVCCVANGQTARMLIVQTDGKIRVANMGSTGSNQICTGSVCYPIAS